MKEIIIKQVITSFELEELIKQLKISKIIVLDTEFTRRNTYYPILDLLQISIKPNEAYILDNKINPSFVKKVLDEIYKSEAIKVFHSAKNDLEIFYNIMNKIPSNIFDTQIAFMALSTTNNISYADLIKELFNKDINKSLTLSNWNNRPLTPQQLEYAALDVIYLYYAYIKLNKLLRKKHRRDCIVEKINELYNTNNYEFCLDTFIIKYCTHNKIKKNFNLLASLLDWREKTAQNHNVPRQYIIKDDTIKNILKTNYDINTLNFNKNFTPAILRNIINSASNHNKYNHLIIRKGFSSKDLIMDTAYELLNFLSKKFKIHKDLITNKDYLNQFLSDDTINNSYFLDGWRYKFFGKFLIKLLSGKLSMRIKNRNIYFK